MDAFDAAEFALSELMPQKSRNIYMSQYERFMKWCFGKIGYSINLDFNIVSNSS